MAVRFRLVGLALLLVVACPAYAEPDVREAGDSGVHDAGDTSVGDTSTSASGDTSASASASVETTDAEVVGSDTLEDATRPTGETSDATIGLDATTDAGPDATDAVVSPHTAPPTPPAPPPTPPKNGATLSTGEAIKAIFGIVLLLALAYIGGHPRVQRLEQKLRISQVITAGFPFVIIGLISREGALGILSEPVLDTIRPLLPLGLGWIGFAVGFRFDVRKLERMPPLGNEAFVATTAVPYLFILGAVAAFLLLSEGEASKLALRDAFVLATAGAMTAIALPRILARQGADRVDIDRVDRIIQLEELAALLGVIIIGAFFRPDAADLGWRLPSVGWVFVTIGIGTALSGVVFALLGTIKGPAETIVVMLGSISFAAGMASFLRLSPVVVCFIAGAVLSNFPGPWKEQVRTALARVERPVYLLFLVIAGALWRVDEWEGWVLMLIFVAARLLGRLTGVTLFARRHPEALTKLERRHLAISPMGALSLAIIVTAQDLYSGPTVPWMVNAVIGGAILTEIIVQIFAFERPRTRPVTRTSMPVFVIEHTGPLETSPPAPPVATFQGPPPPPPPPPRDDAP